MVKNRKTSEDKFDSHKKKKTEMNKVFIMVCPLKPQDFSDAMTTE